MKAKERVPEKSEQPKTLYALLEQEKEKQLGGWKEEIVALVEARLKINGKEDVIADSGAR